MNGFTLKRTVLAVERGYIEAETIEQAREIFERDGVELVMDDTNSDSSGVVVFEDSGEGEPPDPEVDSMAALREKVRLLRGALADCKEWESAMGGWEAPCWRKAETVLELTKDDAS